MQVVVQSAIRNAKGVYETLVDYDVDTKQFTTAGTPEQRAKVLALLAYYVANMSPLTRDVIPAVPATAVTGQKPNLQLMVSVVDKGDEIFCWQSSYQNEGAPKNLDRIMAAFGQTVGALTAPPEVVVPEKKIEPPVIEAAVQATKAHRARNPVGLGQGG